MALVFSGGGINGQMGAGPHRSSGLFNSPGGMPDRYGGGGGGAMELDSWDERRGGRDRRYNRWDFTFPLKALKCSYANWKISLLPPIQMINIV